MLINLACLNESLIKQSLSVGLTSVVLCGKYTLVDGSDALRRNCFLFIESECSACMAEPGCLMSTLKCYF